MHNVEVYVLTVIKDEDGRVIFESRAPFVLSPSAAPVSPRAYKDGSYKSDGYIGLVPAMPEPAKALDDMTAGERAAEMARRAAAQQPPVALEETDPILIDMFKGSARTRGLSSVDQEDEAGAPAMPHYEAMA